jgi:methionyl-tRNA synthetase
VPARRRRRRGDEVRFQTGTDDNALKNVQGAEVEGITPLDSGNVAEAVAVRASNSRGGATMTSAP